MKISPILFLLSFLAFPFSANAQLNPDDKENTPTSGALPVKKAVSSEAPSRLWPCGPVTHGYKPPPRARSQLPSKPIKVYSDEKAV